MWFWLLIISIKWFLLSNKLIIEFDRVINNLLISSSKNSFGIFSINKVKQVKNYSSFWFEINLSELKILDKIKKNHLHYFEIKHNIFCHKF